MKTFRGFFKYHILVSFWKPFYLKKYYYNIGMYIGANGRMRRSENKRERKKKERI